MGKLIQRLVPGIVGISTYVDFAYLKAMQLAAVAAAGTSGPINQLRSVTATLNFAQLIANLRDGNRSAAEEQVATAAQTLEAAGSNFIVVTSGTTSTLTGLARQRLTIPFTDIAKACWRQERPISPVGLLSTRFAAEGGMFHAAAKDHNDAVLLPNPEMAELIDQLIFDELVCGTVSSDCLAVFSEALRQFAMQGARSVILGNTDMTLVAETLRLRSPLPLIDAALAHACEAAYIALEGKIESNR